MQDFHTLISWEVLKRARDSSYPLVKWMICIHSCRNFSNVSFIKQPTCNRLIKSLTIVYLNIIYKLEYLQHLHAIRSTTLALAFKLLNKHLHNLHWHVWTILFQYKLILVWTHLMYFPLFLSRIFPCIWMSTAYLINSPGLNIFFRISWVAVFTFCFVMQKIATLLSVHFCIRLGAWHGFPFRSFTWFTITSFSFLCLYIALTLNSALSQATFCVFNWSKVNIVAFLAFYYHCVRI